MAERENWEYLCRFVEAQIENAGADEYIKTRWPNWKAPRHAPQTMDPVLNGLGSDGLRIDAHGTCDCWPGRPGAVCTGRAR